MKRFACIVYIALSGLLIFNSCISGRYFRITLKIILMALWKDYR